MKTFSIEKMAAAGYTTPRAVRLWEEQGWLGEVARDERDNRTYTEVQLGKAMVIGAARACDMTTPEIENALAFWGAEERDKMVTRLETAIDGLTDMKERLEKAPLSPRIQRVEPKPEVYDL